MQSLYSRPHQAEPLHQVSSGRASAPTSTRPRQAEPPPRRQPGLIVQSLHTNANQVSSSRASAPTSTRPHQAEPPHIRQPGLIEQSLHIGANQVSSGRASTPIQPGFTGLSVYINANQAWSILDKRRIKFTMWLITFLCSCVLFYLRLEVVGVVLLDTPRFLFFHPHFPKVILQSPGRWQCNLKLTVCKRSSS